MNGSKNAVFSEKDVRKGTALSWNTYDSLLEINLTTGMTNTIFYGSAEKEEKNVYKTSDLRNNLALTIHDRDRKKFNRLLSENTLMSIIKNKYTRRVEFRFRCNEGENKRLRMLLTPYYETENNTVLCYNYIVNNYKNNERLMKFNEDFINLFSNTYRSIYIIDLQTGFATVYKNSEDPKTEGEIINWGSFINEYVDNIVCYNDKKIVNENFDLSGLINLYKSQRNEFFVDIRRKTDTISYFWAEIGVRFGITQDNVTAYITERDSDNIHLLQSIVSEFVYKDCDYFICLNANNNSYTMLSYNDRGTPIPPKISSDYISDMRRQVNEYVVEEEREHVSKNLYIENMIKYLENSNNHTISFGLINNKGDYERKLVKYVYYDRLNKMILLIRTDITDEYLEHIAKNDNLRIALESAQRDPLTQVYNRKAVKNHINKRLLEINGRLSAMLFLDLDDFKDINDNLGHAEGDFTLKMVADALNKSVRCSDFVGRYGGDEFIVFLSEITSKGEVLRCVERIFKCFDSIYSEHVQGKNVSNFSCSIGIAFSPENGDNFDILVNKADIALYKSKRIGKNCCSIYSENMQY